MTIALLFLFMLIAWDQPLSAAAETDNVLNIDVTNPAALEEATRVLAEEIKLAARPSPYLLVDLVANAVILKARGIELYRLPLSRWSAESREGMSGAFKLIARPSVIRRKINPVLAADQEPISLADMPIHYLLAFTPPLNLEITPAADEAPLRWTLLQAKAWWRWLRGRYRSFASGAPSSPDPYLLLTLSENRAQSLAWSLVDGMSLVIHRPTD
ncbi:MAG TPA: hypothetical protein VIU63_09575 [Nitrospira sp.]